MREMKEEMKRRGEEKARKLKEGKSKDERGDERER